MNRDEQVAAISNRIKQAIERSHDERELRAMGSLTAFPNLWADIRTILDAGDVTVRQVRERLEALSLPRAKSVRIDCEGRFSVESYTGWTIIASGKPDPDNRAMLAALDGLIAAQHRKAEQQTDRELRTMDEPVNSIPQKAEEPYALDADGNKITVGCWVMHTDRVEAPRQVTEILGRNGFKAGGLWTWESREYRVVPAPSDSRPVPRVESPGGHEYVYRDGSDVVIYYNEYCDRKAVPADEQNWDRIVNERTNRAGWHYIGPVNDGDCEPDSVPEPADDPQPRPSERSMQLAAQCWTFPQTSHLVMEPALAQVFAALLDHEAAFRECEKRVDDGTDEPANDPPLSEIMAAVGPMAYWVEIIDEKIWVLMLTHGDGTHEEVASNTTDPDPVTAIRRLTAKPEPTVEELARNVLAAIKAHWDDVDSVEVKRAAERLRKAMDAKAKAAEAKP